MQTIFKSVLVADDDALTRSAYKASLERNGLQVFTAQDGDEAIRMVERNPIDLLLLDILMPKKEGLETLIELKKRFPALVIIAMSAGGSRSETDFLAIASKFGANGVLRKPFTPRALFDMMGSLSAPSSSRMGQTG